MVRLAMKAHTLLDTSLRLDLPLAKLADFQQWFLLRFQREVSPLRELKEELVEEFKLLDSLDAEQIIFRYLWTDLPPLRPSVYPGKEYLKTQFLFEVFDISFSSKALGDRILAQVNAGKIVLASEKEIQDQRSNQAVEFTGSAFSLLDHNPLLT